MVQEAMAYLNEALDYIQEHSVKRENINWETLRQEVSALAAQAQTSADTYPAIKLALQLLGDHHSFFLHPQEAQLRMKQGQAKQIGLRAVHPEGIIGLVYPGSPAENAGLHAGDRIETLNGFPMAALSDTQFRTMLDGAQLDLTCRSASGEAVRSLHLRAAVCSVQRQPQGRRLAQNIGYVDLPGQPSAAYSKTYAETVQQIIRDIDQTATHGWVIDLRRDTGGDCWPMRVGVGPVLGEGECAGFVSPGEKTAVFYRRGQAGAEPWGVLSAVDDPYQLKRSSPPVAVLTSQLTASAGEFVALAFRGHPHARSFGEPTRGLPTGNELKMLEDGAAFALTEALGTDRTGQAYDGPLTPDQVMQIDWTQLGTVDDPVLQAACQWLLRVERNAL